MLRHAKISCPGHDAQRGGDYRSFLGIVNRRRAGCHSGDESPLDTAVGELLQLSAIHNELPFAVGHCDVAYGHRLREQNGCHAEAP